MKQSIVLFAIPALMLSAACSVQTGSEAEGHEDVATTSEALSLADGFGVTWTKVGTPQSANYLAACGETLFVQNDNGAIYWNKGGGGNSDWVWSANRATASAGIGCHVTTLFVLNQAAPKNMYRSLDRGANWSFVDSPSSAQRIGSGGPELIWVVNTNKDIYSGSMPYYNSPWSGWTKRSAGTHGGGVDRVTGGKGNGTSYRLFTLTGGNDLHYNDKILTSSSSANYKTFPNGGHNFDEIAAMGATKLYGLKDGSRELWRGDVTEQNCFDGVDNDNDGIKDGTDPDCYAKYAARVCENYGTGKWCIGRLTSATTGQVLATCSGSTVVSYGRGDTCVEANAHGQDYLIIVK